MGLCPHREGPVTPQGLLGATSLLSWVPRSLADRHHLFLLLKVLPSLSFSSLSVISLLALENQELAVKASHKMLQTTASFVLSS